jgi:hypothetical protein
MDSWRDGLPRGLDMNVVVLRVFSPVFDVKAFLGRYPGLDADAVWQRGDARTLRRTHEDSGFNLTLVEARTGALALTGARHHLEKLAPMLAELRRQSVACLVDFGMFVGSSRQFTGSVRLSPEDLQWFAEQGLGIAVSAYPTSDEEDEEEGEQA